MTENSSLITLRSLFWTKEVYRHIASDFYPCHSKDLNLILHILGAGIQMWGAVQGLFLFDLQLIVYAFVLYVGLTCPLVTSLLHTLLFYGFIHTKIPSEWFLPEGTNPVFGCLAAFACGFLKDVGHHICDEPAFIGSYIKDKPHIFFFHTTFHLPFLIDAYSPFSTVKPKKGKMA
jgi:hypothetical protein